MKNSIWTEERDQNWGFLFCLASCLAHQLVLLAGRASDGCFPTRQNSLCLLNNWYLRCGKQFLKSETKKFLLKTGLPSVVDLFMCLWWVKASPQVCSFICLWNILLFHACSCDPCTYSYLLCRQWLPGYLQFLHQKALTTDQWRIISLHFRGLSF